MTTDQRRQDNPERLTVDRQQTPGKPRPAADPLDGGGWISAIVADAARSPGRVDAAEAVTGTRARPGGEAPADEDPGEDASLET